MRLKKLHVPENFDSSCVFIKQKMLRKVVCGAEPDVIALFQLPSLQPVSLLQRILDLRGCGCCLHRRREKALNETDE